MTTEDLIERLTLLAEERIIPDRKWLVITATEARDALKKFSSSEVDDWHNNPLTKKLDEELRQSFLKDLRQSGVRKNEGLY